MIKKMSSQEYNNILSEATNKIENISLEMKNIKNDVFKKLLIAQHEQEYLNYIYSKTIYSKEKDDTFIFLNNKDFEGLYNGYSNVVHAYFKQSPINIFNLKVINGKESYFRDEVTVNINGVEDEYFKNILKADDVKGKEIFFEELEFKSAIKYEDGKLPIEERKYNSIITMEVDKNKVIGISKFNIIEIDPFLHRSFDIESIEVYTDESETPTVLIKDLKKIGKTRFILDKKYEFKKIVFRISHKYTIDSDEKKICPFGLKHIFFYEADFRNDSYITVHYKSEEFIDDIKDSLTVLSSVTSRISSLSEEGIKIFLANNNGILENEQEPSNDIKKPIARNLKDIYFKIPLKNEAIIGYNFLITKR